jgi:hypothetical protein
MLIKPGDALASRLTNRTANYNLVDNSKCHVLFLYVLLFIHVVCACLLFIELESSVIYGKKVRAATRIMVACSSELLTGWLGGEM